MYILDTNIISAARRIDRAPQVAAWLKGRVESDLYLSVISLGEIERGIYRQDTTDPDFAADFRNWMDRTVLLFADRIVSFGAEEARLWGRLTQQIGHSGADLMIAATALARDWTVVTRNVADFQPTGVKLENPFD